MGYHFVCLYFFTLAWRACHWLGVGVADDDAHTASDASASAACAGRGRAMADFDSYGVAYHTQYIGSFVGVLMLLLGPCFFLICLFVARHRMHLVVSCCGPPIPRGLRRIDTAGWCHNQRLSSGVGCTTPRLMLPACLPALRLLL